MDPEVWIIAPKPPRHPDPPVCREIRRLCDQRQWLHRLLTPTLRKDSAGKPATILEPEWANNLYQRLHQTRLGLLVTDEVFVGLNPSRYILDDRWRISLARLVRYKCFQARVAKRPVPVLLDEFAKWAGAAHCEGQGDPRVLPLHTFCPSRDWIGLDSASDRSSFQTTYGPPSRRVCEQQMTWKPDPSAHGGREPQNVAGLMLSEGFHWDAEAPRRPATLYTLLDVLMVPGGEHVNVYPNGYVRGDKTTRLAATVRTGAKGGQRRQHRPK